MRAGLDSLCLLRLAVGCDSFTDPSARLAADIEAASNRLSGVAGARYTADQVGALIDLGRRNGRPVIIDVR